MQTYQYSKLLNPRVDIRLLDLLPGKFDDEIRITIKHVPLSQPPEHVAKRLPLEQLIKTLPPGWIVLETVEGRYLFEDESDRTFWTHPDPQVNTSSYELDQDGMRQAFEPKFEALSYTWGSAENPQAILVESQSDLSDDGSQGSPPHSTLQIQQNLATALRYLRFEGTTRTLWVDAVSINQNDITERNEQVTRMKDLYKLAYRILIWLGPESINCQLALSTLGYLGCQLEYTKNGFRACSPSAAHPDWYLSHTKLPYDNDTWQSILDLVNRPWFERLWVTQEVQLANPRATMHCGYDQIPWSQFRRALNCLAEKENLPLPELRYRLDRIRSLGRYLVGQPLQILLNDCQTRLCSDPRDKVYGLLGLAPANAVEKIKPKYSSPVSQVYMETSLVLLDQTKRLSFLYCGCEGSTDTMPSWVPDWSLPVEVRSSGLGFSSGISRAEARFKAPSTLEVQGIACGTVRSVSDAISVGQSGWNFDIRRWFQRNVKGDYYPTGGSSLEALAATLLINRFKERFPKVGHRYPSLEEWTTQIQDYMSDSNHSHQLITKTFSRTFREDQQLFMTDDGHIGLTAGHPMPGSSRSSINVFV